MAPAGLIKEGTVQEIKDALDRCRTVQEVNSTAAHYALHVKKLEESKKKHNRTMAIQIKNLAKHRRTQIKWGKG